MRTVSGTKVGRYLVGFPAGFADFGDHRRRVLFPAVVMDEHLGTRFGQRKGTGAADAA